MLDFAGFFTHSRDIGFITDLRGAILAVTVVVWLAMRFSTVIHRILTDNGVELLTRIAGLLLSAIAVQLVATAVLTFAHQH